MTPLVIAVTLVAGALGALVRYGVTRAVARRSRLEKLPRAVLIVNIVGSLIAGVVIGLPFDEPTRLVLASGFAGGLSTFSTWTVETVQQILDGRARAAMANVVANLIGGLAAAFTAAVITTIVAFGVFLPQLTG